MPWIFLLLASSLEIVWAYSLKLSDGFTRPLPALITVVAMLGSIGMLALAMRDLPLGTAYMIWTGLGAIGTFLIGILLLGEPLSSMRVLAAVLIGAGLVTMKFSS
jgi:quaternary ammonium compound-resistance protein SugE